MDEYIRGGMGYMYGNRHVNGENKECAYIFEKTTQYNLSTGKDPRDIYPLNKATCGTPE
jgi:hypothetical protein